MRFLNGILAVFLTLGALVLTSPSTVAAKSPTGEPVKEVDAKSGCAADKRHAGEDCATKLTADPANKPKNLKPAPVPIETTGAALTTRAAHPRR
jgi:hypothetical protein